MIFMSEKQRIWTIILMRKRNLHKKSEKVAYALVYVIFLYYLCAGNNRSS